MKTNIYAILSGCLLLICSCTTNSKQSDNKPAEVKTDTSQHSVMPSENTLSLSQKEFEKYILDFKAELEKLSQQELRETLEGAIADVQAQLPVETVEGMMMADIQIADDAVVYYILCDETIVDMDDFKTTTTEEQEIVNDMLDVDVNNAENALFSAICKVAGMDIVYVFVGDNTEKEYGIRINHEEMLSDIIDK